MIGIKNTLRYNYRKVFFVIIKLNCLRKKRKNVIIYNKKEVLKVSIKVMDIYLENFKSFKKIELNLENKKNKEAKNLICIYGENGSGKTNIINSMFFLRESLQTMSFGKLLQETITKLKDEKNLQKDLINEIIKNSMATDIDILANNYHYIDNNEPMILHYKFLYKGAVCDYNVKILENKLISESLFYKINKKYAKVFFIESDFVYFSPSIFLNEKYNSELQEKIKQYWGKHTFLSIILAELTDKNKKYTEENLDETLLEFIKELNDISVATSRSSGNAFIQSKVIPLENNISGTLDKNKVNILEKYSQLLNLFYTSMYSDIDKVYYEVTDVDDSLVKYELFLNKYMNGELKRIPFKVESNGTKKLLFYFSYILNCIDGKTVFIDEMDNGIHDLLFASIINALQDTMTGQLVITTHNTTLLEILEPKEIYVIQKDYKANTNIESINNYKDRTQKSNNMRIKYLRGDYEGIPHSDFLDIDFLHDKFSELKNEVINNG